MRKTALLLASAFFTIISITSIDNSLATEGSAPPPPPPPPSPVMGAKTACPNLLSEAQLGKYLRNGIRAGVITTKEGVAEDEVLKAMMTSQAPAKQTTAEAKSKRKPSQDHRANPQMMEELNKRLLKRSQSAPVILPSEKSKTSSQLEPASNLGSNLRKSSPDRMQSNNDQASKDQAADGANPWGVKLRKAQ